MLTRAALQLTPEDWEAVRRAAPKARDPLFADDAHERYRQLRRRIVIEA